jgi:hypothetical protein
VLDLQILVQKNAMAGPAHAVAKLYIFGAAPIPIQPAESVENHAAHCTATSPESGSLRIAFLVDEMVLKVLIL